MLFCVGCFHPALPSQKRLCERQYSAGNCDFQKVFFFFFPPYGIVLFSSHSHCRGCYEQVCPRIMCLLTETTVLSKKHVVYQRFKQNNANGCTGVFPTGGRIIDVTRGDKATCRRV